MKDFLKKIDWRSKKTIAVIVVSAVVLVGAVTAGIVYAATREVQPESVQVYYSMKALDPNTTEEDIVYGRPLTLNTGEKVQLQALVEPEDCVMEPVWSIQEGDEGCISIDADAIVTAEAEGTVIVAATVGEGKNARTGTITVTVEKSEAELVDELRQEIAALPDAENLTAEDQERVDALIEQYNSLSATNRSQLAEESAKLQSAGQKIEEITGSSTVEEVEVPTEPTTTTPEAPTSASGGNTSATTPSTGSSGSSGNTNTGSNSGGSSSSTSRPSSSTGGSSSSGGGSSSTSKPSGGGSTGSGGNTSKPTEPATSTPEPEPEPEFAMTADEIIAYANSYIQSKWPNAKYLAEFNKNNSGWNAPMTIAKSSNLSASEIQRRIRGSADATYGAGSWYKVYVEMRDADTMVVYMFYG